MDRQVNGAEEDVVSISLEKCRATFDHHPAGVMMVRDGRVCYANEALAAMTCKPREDILSARFSDLLVPECLQGLVDPHRESLKVKRSGVVYKAALVDGMSDVTVSEILVDCSGNPAMLAMLFDLSNYRKTPKELPASEELLRLLMERSYCGVCTIDLDRRITFVNKSLCRLSGYTPDELVGQDFRHFLSDEVSREAAESFLQRCLEGDTTSGQGVLSVTRKTGESLFVRVQGEAVRESRASCVMVEVLDVTSEVQAKNELEAALDGTLLALSRAIDLRDPYTAGHQRQVSLLSEAIAKRMQLDSRSVEAVRIAGLIHDVGKVAVPAEILSKPAPLSEGERLVLEQHPRAGYEVLKNVAFPWPIAQIVLQHHERLDGSGYPNKICGDEIMLEARILAVADIIDAMQAHRPYRSALGRDLAVEEIKREAGRSLDSAVVAACCEVLETDEFAAGL